MIYKISFLNGDEAMKLFCKHAFRGGNPMEDYESLSNEVVSYARGLPLALKVMGSLLCDKDKSEWVSALARLRDIPEDGILETLKISYDGLKPLEKELFLDIACFFRGQIIAYYTNPWEIFEACGLHPKIGVRTLVEKALITVSKEGFFDMHDLIQEMGHYIIREKYPRNPKKYSRVWQKEDLVKISTTPMEENHWITALEVDYGFEFHHNLPRVVANMKELRWISYCSFPTTSLARNFQSTQLCYLQLLSSSLEQLWDDDTILPNLKVLDLRFSRKLISTPNFQGLPCLERIRFSDCHNLTHVHPSISNHETLIFVDMSLCKSLQTFPPISEMKSLETLILYGCCNLCKFPEIQANMDNMVDLSLARTGIPAIPSSIGKYCTNLISFDHSLSWHYEGFIVRSMEFLGFPSSLRRLRLSLYDWTRDISSVLCELPNLQVLDLSKNTFSVVPVSLLQLCSLKFLNLSSCHELVELPDLPESIAFLQAYYCRKLKITSLPTNLRWLWRISLPMKSISGDVHRKVQSMLQGNAIKDYSIRLSFDVDDLEIQDFARRTPMLDLPRNWYIEFSGFLICVNVCRDHWTGVITIKDEICWEHKDHCNDGTNYRYGTSFYIYISFSSLRHTSWWKSRHTIISFSRKNNASIKVQLVPRNKGDSEERVKDTIKKSSEFWDTEPIEIIHDSESCIEIRWDHDYDELMKPDMFHDEYVYPGRRYGST